MAVSSAIRAIRRATCWRSNKAVSACPGALAIPDNGGAQPIDTPVQPGGPAAYFASLPIKAMLRAVQRAGVPCEVSQTAGTFVCNHVLYGLMHLLADWPNPLGVPWLYWRHSLNWWKSGRCDLLVVGASWIAAFVCADHVWFDGIHSLWLVRGMLAVTRDWIARA